MQLEEKMLKAEEAQEAKVEIEADKSLEVEMTPTELKSAGYVIIYDTRTFEPSVCSRNTLRHNLQKKRPDGSIVFTTVKPRQKPKRGHLKCMLHADSPNREHYDELGLPVCPKANLTSPYQVIRHMQKRHKVEYATIKEEETRLEKEQERQLRESIIRLGTKEERPLYVKEKK